MWTLESVPFQNNTEFFGHAEDIFTDEQLEQIIKIGLKLKKQDSAIGQTENGVKNKKVRKSKNSWITPTEETEWLFRKLSDVISTANRKLFNFELYGMMEPLQFTVYEDKGSKYDSHLDMIKGTTCRKLSFVLQLSDPKDYSGGDLEVYTSAEPIKIKKQKGLITFFPSYILHGVKPVTKGTRYSLVVWVHGPAFR